MTVPPVASVNPSTSARPDLDWSQVRETILMLDLAVAQMEMAMSDSADSVDVLTHAFTSMFDNLMALREAVADLPESPLKQRIEATSEQVSGQMQAAIIAFQFYDRLSQRLAHVSSSLTDLTGIVSEPARLYNPFAWHELQQKIRSQYTMEDERAMFDTLLATGNVRLALEQYVARRQQAAGDGSEIELF